MKTMTVAELRKVTKPSARRGQCRFSVVERDRVVRQIANNQLFRLVAETIAPRVERGQSVEVRWSYLTRRGMTPWVKVITVHEDEQEEEDEPRASRKKEPDLGVKDGRDILHIVPAGYDFTTRCGLDVEYGAMLPVTLDTNLPHCPTCWAEQ
jgi:hypothetical protein